LKELLDRKATEREIATVPTRQKKKPLEQEKANDPA
jgi:hypothetical protein